MPASPPASSSSDQYIELLSHALRAVAGNRDDEATSIIDQLRADLPRGASDPSVPPMMQVSVWRRDRFTCRYCGGRTIPPPVLRAISLRWPELVPGTQATRADAVPPPYLAQAATIDHVRPSSRGGPTAEENLVTACWVCNTHKGGLGLERLGWVLLDVADEDWDGLVSTYPRLWESICSLGIEHDALYHAAWLRCFAERAG